MYSMLWSLAPELWLFRGWCWPAGRQGCVCAFSHLFATSGTIAHYAPPSMECYRQERCQAGQGIKGWLKVWGRFQGSLVQGAQSWDDWRFKGLKAARLLVGKAVSPPGQLLVLSCLSTGANRLVGPSVNKLEGFQNDICQYQCLCGRTSSPKWMLHLCPLGVLQLPPASLGGFPKVNRQG